MLSALSEEQAELIRNKKTTGRLQDLADVARLEEPEA
jgi:hypothetical protein